MMISLKVLYQGIFLDQLQIMTRYVCKYPSLHVISFDVPLMLSHSGSLFEVYSVVPEFPITPRVCVYIYIYFCYLPL